MTHRAAHVRTDTPDPAEPAPAGAPNTAAEPDVLVIGGGIAGTMAALAAARAGAAVVLACAGTLFSGSSFYPGTWGLGLVGPEDEGDEAELADTICAIGGGAANRELVESFVAGIRPAIAELEALGVALKRPKNADDQTFIPCFDHKHRLWRGITRESYEQAVGAALAAAGVRVLERRELMNLVEVAPTGEAAGAARGADERQAAGAVLYNRENQRFEEVRAGAVVLACGGYGGLFERRLTAADVLGSAQAVAAEHGCGLVNLEFMQIMPAIVSPRRAWGTVFNEKTWRYAQLVDDAGRDALTGPAAAEGVSVAELLEARSGHGPFSSRLVSRAVDLAIDAAGERGLTVRYPGGLTGEGVPEFVRAFSSWLAQDKGVTGADELRVAEFAHAANGGIRIDAQAATDLPGLFACGECTGGMHGADRLGGLSSANGLVFGLRAGRSAAAWVQRVGGASGLGCKGHGSEGMRRADREARVADAGKPHEAPPALTDEQAKQSREEVRTLAAKLRRRMSASCMVRRTAAGLTGALEEIEQLEERRAAVAEALRQGALENNEAAGAKGNSPRADAGPWLAARGDAAELLASLRRLELQLALARRIAQAALARTESCGSHYRADA